MAKLLAALVTFALLAGTAEASLLRAGAGPGGRGLRARRVHAGVTAARRGRAVRGPVSAGRR